MGDFDGLGDLNLSLTSSGMTSLGDDEPARHVSNRVANMPSGSGFVTVSQTPQHPMEVILGGDHL